MRGQTVNVPETPSSSVLPGDVLQPVADGMAVQPLMDEEDDDEPSEDWSPNARGSGWIQTSSAKLSLLWGGVGDSLQKNVFFEFVGGVGVMFLIPPLF